MNTGFFQTLFFCILFFAAALTECLCGTVGWILPLVPPCFYFLTLHLEWQKAAAAAILLGSLLDLLLGRDFPVSIPALLAMLPGAYLLREQEYAETEELWSSIAGGIAGTELVYAFFNTADSLPGNLLQTFLLILIEGLITLTVIRIGRAAAGKLGLPDTFVPLSTLRRKRLFQKKTRVRQS